MYNSKRSPAMIAHLTSPGCLSLIRSISAQSSSWGGGSTFGAPNLNLVISLAPLDRVLHTSSRSESQLNPTPTYAPDAADKDSRRYGYSPLGRPPLARSEEHTSELQSLMRISYAVFCLKQKIKRIDN